MLVASPIAWAQESEKTAPVVLEAINITATRSEKQLSEIPSAVTLIEQDQQQEFQPGATLDEFARGTPGVFFQNPSNFAQDLRISIRGFGARSSFGVRGIHMRVDGIPQTLPDGQTQLDTIDPSLLERMEIIRGPSASLFGNASGGMINMTTRSSPREKFAITPRQIFGQYGYFKSEIFAGGREKNFDYGLFGSHLQQKGWRNHSQMQNIFSQAKFYFQTSANSDLMVLFRKFYSPESRDPGGLTSPQVRSNRRQAAPRNLLFNTGEEVSQEQFGLRYRKRPSATQQLTITAHFLHRDFQNRLPFTNGGQVQFDRWVGGLAIQYENNHILFKRPNRLLVGVDYGIQNDDRRRFNNNDGNRGALTLNQLERVQSIGPFFRNEWRVIEDVDVVVGGRWDWIHYHVGDAFKIDANQSGSRTLSQGSGTVGLVYHLNDQQQIYINVATVFEAPTTTELINNPAGIGGFNPNLKAQTSLSKELGFRGVTAGFQYETTVFHISSRNEITPFELSTSPGRAFFRNTRQSRRIGVETRLASPEWKGFRGEVSYTYSNFEFKKFIVDNNNLQGNAFPGIPTHRWEGILRYAHPSGVFGQMHVQHVGNFYVNDTNTASNNAYNLGQLLIGWQKKHQWIEGSIFLGINNLFNAKYNSNTRINAAFGRYFEPGAPINFFGGLRLRIVPF